MLMKLSIFEIISILVLLIVPKTILRTSMRNMKYFPALQLPYMKFPTYSRYISQLSIEYFAFQAIPAKYLSIHSLPNYVIYLSSIGLDDSESNELWHISNLPVPIGGSGHLAIWSFGHLAVWQLQRHRGACPAPRRRRRRRTARQTEICHCAATLLEELRRRGYGSLGLSTMAFFQFQSNSRTPHGSLPLPLPVK